MTQHKLSRRVLRRTADLVVRWPRLVLVAYVVAVAASVAVTALRLRLKTDQNDLVSADLPYNQRYLAYLEDFGDLEYLYVAIVLDEYLDKGVPFDPGADPLVDRNERAIDLAEDIVRELAPLEDYVEEVRCRVNPRDFGDSVLLLGTEQDLRDLVQSVKDNTERLRQLGQVNSFPSLFRFVARSMDASAAERDPEAAEWGFRFLDMSLKGILSAARGESPPPLEQSIEAIALGPGRDPRDRGYWVTGSLLLVEIMPRKDYETLEVIREPLAKIREALARVRARHVEEYGKKALSFGLTGRPVLQADEMQTTDVDMRRASIFAVLGVLALFVVFFRRLRRPLIAILSLATGIALTFGVVTVTIGYLTLLSIVFTVMLIGLGIDFGVHFLARYQEELIRTHDIEDSIRNTLESSGLAIWTGGITTAVAFYSTCFVNFKGLAELGFVAGTGLILCMVTMLTLLPAGVLVTDRRVARRRGLEPPPLIVLPGLSMLCRRPLPTLLVLGALTLAGAHLVRGIPYNFNLLDLQAKGLPSVDYELKIIAKSDRSTWDASFIVPDIAAVDETLRRLAPWREKGIVGAVESVRDLVQADQAQKMEILRPVAEILDRLELSPPPDSLDPEDMKAASDELVERLDQLLSMVASRTSEEDGQAREAIAGLIAAVEEIGGLVEESPEAEGKRLAEYQARWFRELRDIFALLRRIVSPKEVTPDSIPSAIRRRYVSSDGQKLLVRAFPMKDVWQEKNMEEFVSAMQSLDPEVTGVSVQVYESAWRMKQGFLLAALYSLVMVFILITVDFRNLRLSCLTLVPLAVGLFWTLELMPLLDLDFNLANFFALPILVGYGVAGGVHVIHRYLESGSTEDLGKTVSSAVALSFLTTIVGFGSLAFAQHRGVAALGIVTSLGCSTVLVASLVVLPCLLALFGRRATGARE